MSMPPASSGEPTGRLEWDDAEAKTVGPSTSAAGDESITIVPPSDDGDEEQTLASLTPGDGAAAASTDCQRQLPSIPGYKILGELGRGGMGVVYHAFQTTLNRTVALKVVLAGDHAAPEDLIRFLNEAEIAAKLRHQGIAQIYERGKHAGLPFFSMEFVDGGSLAQRLRDGPLPPAEAARLVRAIAEAVHSAHELGIVHRDLKPGNILLTAEGQPKITDFGLARRLKVGEGLTKSGSVMGTPGYMAPEQASGKRGAVGPLLDVYSLGAILYCTLTGRPPFQAATPLDTLMQSLECDPISPRSLNPAVNRDLEIICLQCLDKRPERRYASALALAEDLQRYLDHRPIQARPVGAFDKFVRWCRRYPIVAGLLAGIVAIFLAAFILVSWSYVRAEKARELAEQREQDVVEARTAAERDRDVAQWREYRANMEAVSSALNLNSVAEARRLLEASNPDHRGWEWRHFLTRLDGARAVLRHSAAVWHVSFSRDGTRLATASKDGWFRVWDPATGQELFQQRSSDQEDANGYAFAEFLPDGRALSMNQAGKARIWKLDAPEALLDAEAPFGDAYGAWLSPNGGYVAWWNPQINEVWGWDFRQKRAPERLAKSDYAIVNGNIAFSQDGQLLALPTEGGDFVTWDVARRSVLRRFAGHSVRPSSYAFSPVGDRLVSGSNYPESEVRLWTADGKAIHRQNVHRNAINDLAYSPDGSRIASASLDQTIGLWHGATLEPVALLRGHSGKVVQVQFTPDSKRLVSRSDDLSIRLWEAGRGDPVAVLQGHTALINHFAISPNGNTLASASYDGTVRLWDLKQTEAHNGLRGHTSYVYDASFSPDGTQIASAAWDGTVRLWDATTLQELAVLKQETEKEPIVQCVVWSRDGRRLAVVARPHFVHIWDAKERKKLRTVHVLNYQWQSDIRAAFHPDSTLLATGSRDGMVALWNPETGDKIALWNAQHRVNADSAFAGDVAFSPDGHTLATVGKNNVLRLWRMADVLAGRTAEPYAMLKGHTHIIHRVVWSRDGKWLATASEDRSVRLWSADDQKEIAVLPHGSVVYGLALSPDGKRLASGCADNTIRIWDLATHDQVAELRGHNAYVKSVAFSPDGEQLVSASGDYTIRVWDTLSVQVRAKRAADARRP